MKTFVTILISMCLSQTCVCRDVNGSVSIRVHGVPDTGIINEKMQPKPESNSVQNKCFAPGIETVNERMEPESEIVPQFHIWDRSGLD